MLGAVAQGIGATGDQTPAVVAKGGGGTGLIHQAYQVTKVGALVIFYFAFHYRWLSIFFRSVTEVGEPVGGIVARGGCSVEPVNADVAEPIEGYIRGLFPIVLVPYCPVS